MSTKAERRRRDVVDKYEAYRAQSSKKAIPIAMQSSRISSVSHKQPHTSA